MRITQLHMQNFRNYQDFTVDFTDRRTLLVGINGTGKSTIIDAMAWCLMGRCRGVDGRGQGQVDLVGDAGPDMAVTAHVEGLGPVRRAWSPHGTQVSVKEPVAKLRTTDAALTAALYGRTFFGLHHADAKQLLFQLLDVRVEPHLLPALKLKAPATLDELDAYYQAAFQNRAATKKALAAFHVPDPPKVADINAINVRQLETELTQTQQRYQNNVMEHSGKTAELQQVIRQLKEIQAAILANRDQVIGSLDTHRAMLLKATKEAADAKQALTDAEELTAEPVAELQVQVSDLKLLTGRLERHDPEHGCVLHASIPCLTAAGQFSGQISAINKDLGRLAKRIKAGEDRARKIGQAQQQVKDADRNLLYHNGQIAELERKLQAHDDAVAEQTLVNDKHGALQNAVAVLADAVGQATAEMKDLQARIRTAADYSAAMKSRDTALAKQQEFQIQLKTLEDQVDQLGPNGVRLTALKTAVADFEGAINACLRPFGFTLALQADPWSVMVRKGDAKWRPFELLSDGEKLWTGLAFQLALAVQSGLDFCCIDAAETVVGKNRTTFTKLVLEAPVTQVIVAMAKGEDEVLPVIDGLQVVRVDQTLASAAA